MSSAVDDVAGRTTVYSVSNHLLQLNRLAAHESVRLLRALAQEELGLVSEGAGILAHCASRSHSHKSQGQSESLAVRPSSKYSVTRGDSELPSGGYVCCYGACGFRGRLSDYLLEVGAEGLASDFWTPEKTRSVFDALSNNEPLELGWLDFTAERGVTSNGTAFRAETRAALVSETRQTLRRFTDSAVSLFMPPSDKAVLDVANARGWQPQTVRRYVALGIMGITPSKEFDDDYQIAFAYRGVVPSRYHPSRVIKRRLLNHSDHAYRWFFKNPYADSTPIANFSPVSSALQRSATLAFVEGEPDGVSWSEMRPEDGVVVLGNSNVYSALPSLLKAFSLGPDRTLIYCVDADVTPDGQWKANAAAHRSSISALASTGCTIRLWTCPQVSGRPCKDVNDFLKLTGGKKDPLAESVKITSFDDFCEQMGVRGMRVDTSSLSPSNLTQAAPNTRTVSRSRIRT